MFTGIVEKLGVVSGVYDSEEGVRLEVSAPGLGEVEVGASVAVNGVCLTAVEVGDDLLTVDVIPETLERSSLRGIVVGDSLNLERAMPAAGRFDGHVVQGHVDGTGSVRRVKREPDGAVTMEISLPEKLARYVVEKGSITVDGVSLTVAGLQGDSFLVALIPHTLEVTTLGLRQTGDLVNLEVDVLAKYVERILNADQ